MRIDPVLWREFRGEVEVVVLFATLVITGLIAWAWPDLAAWAQTWGVCR